MYSMDRHASKWFIVLRLSALWIIPLCFGSSLIENTVQGKTCFPLLRCTFLEHFITLCDVATPYRSVQHNTLMVYYSPAVIGGFQVSVLVTRPGHDDSGL